MAPSWSPGENETIATILARQTEILDRAINTTAPANLDNRVKLPTIKLPRFDGKIDEWKCFSDTFRSIIHDKLQLSNVEKFQYLVSSISGDAIKIIESIELTGHNYTAAWELLQQRYDDPRSLKKKHIQCLFTMPTIMKESAKALRDLIDYTSRHLRVLRGLGVPIDTWDELIMHMMETKFDVQTLRAWEEEIESKENARLDDMLEFLKRKCQTLERIESRTADKNERSKESDQRGKGSSSLSSKPHTTPRNAASNQRTTSLTTSVSSGKCYFCKGTHFIYFCEKFLALPVADRIKEVRRLKLCVNCLKNDHYVKTCKRGPCRECAEKHNTLCHRIQDGNVPERSEGSEPPIEVNNGQSLSSLTVHHAASSAKRRRILMATVIVDAIRSNGSNVSMRVLLDSASEANFITQAAHNKLGSKRCRVSEIVTGLNEMENKIHDSCEVHVKSKCSEFEFNAQCLIVPKITRNLPAITIERNNLQIPNNLQLADSEFYKPNSIDMLVGAEFFFDSLEMGKLELGKNQLILQNTKFDWVIAGALPYSPSERLNSKCNITCSLIGTLRSCDVLNDNLERFWKLENYSNEGPRVLSLEARKCEQLFEQTTTRYKDGRFVVRLPFREKVPPIGNNKEIALKRLSRLERVLNDNDVMRQRYIQFMREYIELDHMSIIREPSINSENMVYLSRSSERV